MAEGLEDADVAVETHSLLLSLAGLIDDDLLGWCRELVAVGESDYALELVTAAVQADRVRLPGPLHADLLDAAQRRRVLGRGESLPTADSSPRMPHRFAVDPTEHGFPLRVEEWSPETALRSVPPRLLRDCQLWLTWRLTPAGGAPGPLPHPVVLIETLDGVGADLLAYQVAEVLARAGVFASVEVFSSELELNDYHRAALAEAHRVVSPEAGEEHGFLDRAGVGGTGSMETVPPSPRPAPRARVEPGTNGTVRETPLRVPENGVPRPGPAPQDGSRRQPMHPVDRVITARNTAPRRPRPDRQPGSLDDVAAGLNFERGNAGFATEQDAVNGEGELEPLEGQAPVERHQPERPRDSMWNGSHEPPALPRENPPVPGEHPNPGPPPHRGVSPVPGERPPGTPRPGPQPTKRPSPYPVDAATEESANELSDVEQRLLRQLHEELAAREDRSMPTLDADQPPPRIFRSANGGRKRPPRNGPDQTS
jgi:hypothetical protein